MHTASSTSNEAGPALPPVRLGEELPIFCEKCGYSLHGLPTTRCDQCDILHHRCPECGHRQPINTLRPAFQRMLGRLRCAWLIWVMLFKINFFGWLLFAWAAMGYEWSYRYRFVPPAPATAQSAPMRTTVYLEPRSLEWEVALAFAFLGLGFGLFSRMLLLRWRRSAWVGLILSALVALAIIAGAVFRLLELQSETRGFGVSRIVTGGSPFTLTFLILLIISFACVLGAAIIVWPIWRGLVRLLLPQRTATSLLEWQRSMSEPEPEPNAPLGPDGTRFRD